MLPSASQQLRNLGPETSVTGFDECGDGNDCGEFYRQSYTGVGSTVMPLDHTNSREDEPEERELYAELRQYGEGELHGRDVEGCDARHACPKAAGSASVSGTQSVQIA